MPGSPQIVTAADLDRELTIVRASSAGNATGIFGPASMIWHIDRESAVFLGAGRALLLQLAHPWVAAAIAEHSRTLADPIGRFHRTFAVVFTMVFGTTDQAIAAARNLYRRHQMIGGALGEHVGAFAAGSRYRANDVAALRWVHATLTESAVVAYELANPPLSTEDRERYYAEARLFARFFGIPRGALPQSWVGFADYVETMLGSDILTASNTARDIAAALFSGAGTRLRMPRWYRSLTASLLPERLRAGFGLAYGAAEQRAAARALAVLRRVYPCIPAGLRYVGPYHEARARLAGRDRPGALTQVMNRVWIGHNSMAG